MTNGGSYLATALLLLVQLDTVRADECRDYGGVGTDVWAGGFAGDYVAGTAFGCSGYQPGGPGAGKCGTFDVLENWDVGSADQVWLWKASEKCCACGGGNQLSPQAPHHHRRFQ